MDARRSQIYNALFSARDGVLTRLTPDRAISLEEVAAEVTAMGASQITLVGDGAALCQAHFQHAGIPCRLAPPHLVMQNASSVALEALELARAGGLQSAQSLQPAYLRPPHAVKLKDRM